MATGRVRGGWRVLGPAPETLLRKPAPNLNPDSGEKLAPPRTRRGPETRSAAVDGGGSGAAEEGSARPLVLVKAGRGQQVWRRTSGHGWRPPQNREARIGGWRSPQSAQRHGQQGPGSAGAEGRRSDERGLRSPHSGMGNRARAR